MGLRERFIPIIGNPHLGQRIANFQNNIKTLFTNTSIFTSRANFVRLYCSVYYIILKIAGPHSPGKNRSSSATEKEHAAFSE
jgi:hypothetical protein